MISPRTLLLIVAVAGSLTACDATRGQLPALPQPATRAEAPSLVQRGLDAYRKGDFTRAVEFFEQARAESPSDLETAFQLARGWIRNDRALEAEDLVGDLLLADAEAFRLRVQSEPGFDSDGVRELLRSGGASSLPPSDLPTTQFDVDGDGAHETFVVSHRVTRNETFLAAVETATSAEWWGFYPRGSNNFIALHSAYVAPHATATELAALAAVPSVASFLARWSLTPEELREQSEPLVPPSGLWGHAHFLETTDVSTAFSYFRLE